MRWHHSARRAARVDPADSQELPLQVRGDGWLDGDDPACGDAGDEEDDGFGTWDCNDGLDNDGDGRIDAEDPGCNSALDATE